MGFLDPTQMFFLLISIPFLIIAPYCFKNIYEIVEETKLKRPDYVGPKWADFLLLFITLPSIAFGKWVVYKCFSGYYMRNLPHKHQGKLRQFKVEKACENIFKAGYFTAISVYGYFAVVKQLPFETPVLGNGSWHNYFVDFPYTPFLPATTYYCFLNLSYHTESAIQMVVRPGNDFFEMFCHHTMTLLIISIAYITNYNNIAVPFMIVIDNADIFVGLVRALIDVAPAPLVLSAYACILVSWGYTRLYVFPFEIIGVASLKTFHYAAGRMTPHYFMTAMLSVLGILNFYWYGLLLRMGYRLAVGKQGMEDKQKDDAAYVNGKTKNN
uniref:TLC domain-containing protein n=1 Tax=Euplotes harpa TaxID=151035 RepID=A0A7S3NAJ9_9SPIT